MGIHYTAEDWKQAQSTYREWWDNRLERPLFCLTAGGFAPERKEPDLPDHKYIPFYQTDTPMERIIDRLDYNLSGCRWSGDAVPMVWPNFGPGVIAALLGAELVQGKEENTVWFHPRREYEPEELSFTFNDDSLWFRRIGEFMRAAQERWQGMVQVGNTDLGGNLDILSSFRPGEKLLLDLYDHPGEVKRLTREAHEAWWAYFDAFNRFLQPVNPGYSAWAPIYSEEPSYMLQCDFCYMISPAMFDEFVKPELAASCKKLKNAFYHLDGPGQLPHLDSLLEIEELKGVQWVPGARVPDHGQWLDVFKKIDAAGKKMQVWGSVESLRKILDVVKHPGNLIITNGGNISTPEGMKRLEKMERFMEQCGAPGLLHCDTAVTG